MRLYNIPAGVDFLRALARQLLAETAGEPLALSRYTILLPTRRACRALQQIFLQLSPQRSLLLPRLSPLGDADSDELTLRGEAELPPAIAPRTRQFLLMRLLAAKDKNISAAQQLSLAHELANLLDAVETEELDFATLQTLVPQEYAQHWQETLEFLQLITAHWPQILAESGALDPSARRSQLLHNLAQYWQKNPPAGPVIAAGSTGSIPATAALLNCVARLPQGRVVLPALDTTLADDIWQSLPLQHPQYGLAQLLAQLEVTRAQVQPWPMSDGANEARNAMLQAALLPASATPQWQHLQNISAEAIKNFTPLALPHIEAEAQTIALIVRETLETAGRTVLVVTHDRALAQRVAAALLRYDVVVDDSVGQPLSRSGLGQLLRLLAIAAQPQATAYDWLALLKHRLAAFGCDADYYRAQISLFERQFLRGVRTVLHFAGLLPLVQKEHPALLPLINKINEVLSPLTALLALPQLNLPDYLKALLHAAEQLACTPTQNGASNLWQGDAGEVAAQLLAELLEDEQIAQSHWPAAELPALLEGLLAQVMVRPRAARHARVQILSPLEARLLTADVVVLAGLNENSWPPQAELGPFLSRPMCQKFGLPTPERRLGQAAHDFMQLASFSKVYLTRSLRVGGAPTLPARWWLRLEAVWHKLGWLPAQMQQGHLWQHYFAALDKPKPLQPCLPPAPCPPLRQRPLKFSATALDKLKRDPYAYYAQYILRLKALDDIEQTPDTAERGNLVHDVLEQFMQSLHGVANFPPDALPRLLALGQVAFAQYAIFPNWRSLWWPRFERFAQNFCLHQAELWPVQKPILLEGKASIPLAFGEQQFTLEARADRIDYGPDGYVIIDYKSGTAPSLADIGTGRAAQLSIEAVLLRAGGFAGLRPAPIAALEYWAVFKNKPEIVAQSYQGPTPRNKTLPQLEELLDITEQKLRALLAAYAQPQQPYLARPRPDYALSYNDYEHLSRTSEWDGRHG